MLPIASSAKCEVQSERVKKISFKTIDLISTKD